MAREGQICPIISKLSKICPNQCKTIFFIVFLEYLVKFRNGQKAIIKNLLYFWRKFNVLVLVRQICSSLARIGLNEAFWCNDYNAKIPRSLQSPILEKDQKKPAKKIAFLKNGHFWWIFMIFFHSKWDIVKSWDFLRCNLCINTLCFSY